MDDSFIKLDDWETYFCLSNDLEAKKSVGSFVSNISSILYHPFFSQILDPAVAGTKLTGDLTLCGGFDILMEYRRMNNLKIRVAENTIAMADRSLFNVLDTDNSIPGIEAANGNEVFLKVENLPGLHVATLILCEDPDFFFHSGIDLYYVARAFSATVKNKRVSRGASTITMQLMKNLFLHRRKTISRKVNEVILSLLLENHSSVSKQKILEKYINIIEFGPDLYGIMDACRYYFSKHPDELTVPEFITLTYIIPRPIHFHDALLRKTQQLINNLGVHFDKVCLKLMWNELITVDEYKSFNRRIEFANDLGYIDLPRE
jgi:membrane peptidoglycan carboxypeptidase